MDISKSWLPGRPLDDAVQAYLDCDKAHDGHIAGWEVAAPHIDEHEDQRACKESKLEEGKQAGSLATDIRI